MAISMHGGERYIVLGLLGGGGNGEINTVQAPLPPLTRI
jgi:hypothetical protein